MSFLPGIRTGRLVVSEAEPERAQTINTGNKVHRKKGIRSLLEISHNLPSIHHDADKRIRSRSYDPSSGDETETHIRKKVKLDSRSTSLGNSDRKEIPKRRKLPVDINANYLQTDENRQTMSKSPRRRHSDKRVHFDSTSGESNETNGEKISEFKTSTPKPTGVQYKLGELNRNGVSMDTSSTLRNEGSQKGPIGRAAPVAHKARLKAARESARIWAETCSDPGSNDKSIDNQKVIRGQPIDLRRTKNTTDNARSKHALYQARQDVRPRGADKGRRLQSLPTKKESHDSDDRSAISAPSKDQGKMEAPMPKINTLVPKESQDSNHNEEPQPGTSKSEEPNISPTKPLEPAVTSQKREPAVNPQKREPAVSPQKREPAVSPQKREPAVSPQKREPAAGPPKREPEHKQLADTEVAKPKEKSPHAERKVTGVTGRSTKDEDQNRDVKRQLPADDHGPVQQTHKSEEVSKPVHTGLSPSHPNFTYYASEKEKGKITDRDKPPDESSRINSDKSSKTDKITVVKLKNSDTKQSDASYPTAQVKAQTAYELSQTHFGDNSERKRREVTIVDPRYVTKLSKDDDYDDGEPFLHEYEYSHNHEPRHKHFNEMDNEEKIGYFRDQLHMKPDQIRELTFHPKLTEPKVIHHTYTGVETMSWSSGRIKSGRRTRSPRKSAVYKRGMSTLPPSQRKSVMLSKLQGVVYRHINKVYGSSPRDNREKQFFEKLAQTQINDMQHRYEKLAEKERKGLEAKFRQRDQLKRLRRRFEDDAWRRFMTQYVTSKVVEAEYRSREDYGLPDDLSTKNRRHYPTISNVNAKRLQYAMTPRRMHRKNQRKYANLFRFNTGPVMKPGGKPLKFEGIDTVYIDTEDEHGRSTQKKQNVDALMREAKRILDQSDDDADLGIPPKKAYSDRRNRLERPHYHRAREANHIPDDKSFKSSQSSRKSYTRPHPRTMKELMDRRKSVYAPVNRYRASNVSSMKADLLKDSNLLNQNKKLTETQSVVPNTKTSEVNSIGSNQSNAPIDDTPIATRRNMRTPVETPIPARTHSPVKSTVVTTNTTIVDSTKTDSSTKKEGNEKNKDFVYLDDMETQMAIETARDKIDEDTKIRVANHASSKVEKVGDKVSSQTTSRISFRAKQGQPLPKELRPTRAPSRTSVLTSDSKTIASNERDNNSQGRFSRASVIPVEVQHVRKGKDSDSVRSDGSKETKTKSTTIKTESVTETVRSTNSKPIADGKETDSTQSEKVNAEHKSLSGSQINTKQTSHHSSVASMRTPKLRSGRTSVVDIATTNGRVSPTVERQREYPSKREGFVDKKREVVERRESVVDKTSIKSRHSPARNIYTKHMNGRDTPEKKDTNHTVYDHSVPNTVVTNIITMSEDVTETTNVSRNKPLKKHNSESKRTIDYENNDIFSTRKATYHVRQSENNENKEKPKPRERHPIKREALKSKKAPLRRRSRSRTPQRDPNKMNGHVPNGDITMARSKYEAMGHDGNRRSRSDSINGSNRSRKRSTSRGRKGRKRSTSTEKKGRKRSTSRGRNGKKIGMKSRFPDIKKNDDDFITARSPTQTVTRTKKVNENVTERIITPIPQGANQWKDLVEKYLRQPSPKVGRTEDRSLLDASLDETDDEEVDIFARAQQRYKLTVGQSDEDDSDDD